MKKLHFIQFSVLLVISIWAHAVLAIPSITATASTGTTIKFTATLSEKLLSGYKVKIDYGSNKGLVAMTCSGITCSLSTNTFPTGISSASYKIGIYNSQGILQGTTTDGVYVIISPLTTGYTKISNNGLILPDSAALGNGTNDWACTKDNKTGLIWEVKTNDGGLRDMSQKYTNYFISDTGYGQTTNSDYFVSTVNKQTLCGAANWRLPTIEEFKGLIFCSDGQYSVLNSNTPGNICTNITTVVQPTINSNYFPNTQTFAFWSSTAPLDIKESAWYVNTSGGTTFVYYKATNLYIRLVHDDKTTQNTTTADKAAVDYLAGLKLAAEKTAADYLTNLKTTADKTAGDYLTSLKITADKTANDYLTSQKAAADKTAADYLAKLKSAADSSTTTSSSIYVKISNTGAKLTDSAKLGTGTNDWACTKDNKTGLIWEIKTTDGGLRDMKIIYSNYTLDYPNSNYNTNKYGDSNNIDGFVKLVNKQTLCGASNWRLPTRNELIKLVYCSDGKYNTDGSCANEFSVIQPTINKTYFPNTSDNLFWSSSFYSNVTDAWTVSFIEGSSNYDYKAASHFVRLVHD